jgi:hypothetical protein
MERVGSVPAAAIRRLAVAITVALAGAAAAEAPAPAPAAADAEALVSQAIQALPRVPFKAQLRLTPVSGDVRTLELWHKEVGDHRASFLEVKSPTELAGIKFLFLENAAIGPEQYIKIPSGRPVKVEGQIRKQPFLESTFYVSDMVAPKISDYTYAFAGEEEVLGRKATLVEATPKQPVKEIYGKTVLAIDPTDRLILKRRFFDKEGKPLKVWTVEDVVRQNGIWTIRKQTMENVQQQSTSGLESTVEYDVELPDAAFEPQSLAN